MRVEWLAAGMVLGVLPLCAQSDDARFEAASIRPSEPSEQGYIQRRPGGRLEARNVPLRFLMRFAYDLADDQIAGGPAWIDKDHFDIVATPDRDYGNELFSRDKAVRIMLRALLAERFALRTHIETRELTAYVLTVAKGGLRMERSKSAGPFNSTESINGAIHSFTFKAVPVSLIARTVSNQLHKIVIDESGVQGTFDCRLEWTPDIEATDADGGPSIFTALQQQLGLILHARKRPAEVLVVDSAEKPSDN